MDIKLSIESYNAYFEESEYSFNSKVLDLFNVKTPSNFYSEIIIESEKNTSFLENIYSFLESEIKAKTNKSPDNPFSGECEIIGQLVELDIVNIKEDSFLLELNGFYEALKIRLDKQIQILAYPSLNVKHHLVLLELKKKDLTIPEINFALNTSPKRKIDETFMQPLKLGGLVSVVDLRYSITERGRLVSRYA